MKNIVKSLVCSVALFSGLFCGQIDAMRPTQAAAKEISNELQNIIRNDDIDSFQKCFMFVNNPNFDQSILSACRYGSVKIFKYCLLNGAENNLLNLRQDDATALMLALLGGNTEIIHILIQRGAKIDLSVMNDDNINLLYHAYVSSNEGIISWLEDSYGADFEGNSGRLFAVACRNNKSDVAMRLITDYRDHIDPKVLFMKKSAIMYALENGNLEILRMIFNAEGLGIDINSPIGNRLHPTVCPLEYMINMQMFIDYKHFEDENLPNRVYETIAYLLRNGADVFATAVLNPGLIICDIIDDYSDHRGNYESPTLTDKVFELAIRYNYIEQKPKYDVNTLFPAGGALIHRILNSYRLKVLLQIPDINIGLRAPGTGRSLRDGLRMDIEFLENRLKSGHYRNENERLDDQRNLAESYKMLHILDEYEKNHPQANNQ